MLLVKANSGSIIFEKGIHGKYFYIIKTGEVGLHIDEKNDKILSSGDCFGDIAILHDSKRSGTTVANEDTLLWCLERKKFKAIIYFINEKNKETIKTLFESNLLLSKINLI